MRIQEARWTIEVIPAAERELKGLSDDLQGRFLHVAGLLEEFGPTRLGLPHVRPLGGKLWEMRLVRRNTIARAMHFAAGDRRLVVVRMFVKKSQKTPRREIALAERRMKDRAVAGKAPPAAARELLAKPAVREAYEEQEPEYAIARAIIAARTHAGLSRAKTRRAHGNIAAVRGPPRKRPHIAEHAHSAEGRRGNGHGARIPPEAEACDCRCLA